MIAPVRERHGIEVCNNFEFNGDIAHWISLLPEFKKNFKFSINGVLVRRWCRGIWCSMNKDTEGEYEFVVRCQIADDDSILISVLDYIGYLTLDGNHPHPLTPVISDYGAESVSVFGQSTHHSCEEGAVYFHVCADDATEAIEHAKPAYRKLFNLE